MGILYEVRVDCPRLGYSVNIDNECATCPWEGYMDAMEYHCRYEEDSEGLTDEEIVVMLEEFDEFG